MDKLPIEMVLRVIKFLQIADVFICMSVNKTWHEVSICVVRNRKILRFFTDQQMESNNRGAIDDGMEVNAVSGARVTHSKWTKRLLLFEKLRDLCIDRIMSEPSIQLRHLHIDFPESSLVFDSAVERLVRQNPQLWHIVLSGVVMTDASLVSLSRLTSLNDISLEEKENEFTVDGVLTLLRGESRALFCDIRIVTNSNGDNTQILTEFQLMAAETGFDAVDNSVVGVNFIHSFSFEQMSEM